MTTHRILFWAALPALFLLMACPSPTLKKPEPKAGRVVLSLAIPGRTVSTDWNNLIKTYEVTLTSLDGFAPVSATGTGTTLVVDKVRAGTWNIALTAKDAGAVIVATASLSSQTLPSASPITLQVKPANAKTGGYALTVRFPLLPTPIDSISAQLKKPDGTNVGASTTVTAFGDLGSGIKQAVFTGSGLASGPYRLSLVFYQGSTPARYLNEAVNVWDDVTSDRWIAPDGSFSAYRQLSVADFKDDNTSLESVAFTLDGAPVDFSFDPLVLNQIVSLPPTASTRTLKFTPTQALPGQRIEYSVDGAAFQALDSGTVSPSQSVTPSVVNSLALRVTAPNRQTKKTYALEIDKTGRVVAVTVFAESGSSLLWNGTTYLGASLRPSFATNTAVSFSSSDATIASVVREGAMGRFKVVGHRVGSVTITGSSADGPSGLLQLKLISTYGLLVHDGRGWKPSFDVPEDLVALAGNQSSLYSLDADQNLWRFENGAWMWQSSVPEAPFWNPEEPAVELLAVTPQGGLLVANESTVFAWDGAWKSLVHSPTEVQFSGLAVSSDGTIYASFDSGGVAVWSAGLWTEMDSPPGDDLQIGGGADLRALTGAGDSRTEYRWDGFRWLKSGAVPTKTAAITTALGERYVLSTF